VECQKFVLSSRISDDPSARYKARHDWQDDAVQESLWQDLRRAFAHGLPFFALSENAWMKPLGH